MMDDFILRAGLAGSAIALVSGPLGSLVVWRRMAYFGEALSHSALLGVVLGVIVGVSVEIPIVLVCVAVALLLTWVSAHGILPRDTIIGVLAQGSLAVGLIVIAFRLPYVNVMSYLIGDVITISTAETWWTLAAALTCLAVLATLWKPLLLMTLNEELARISGVPVTWMNLLLMLLVSIVVAFAIRVVGAVLIISLLIVPAAVARRFAATPEQMAVAASLAGVVAVWGGLFFSVWTDAPAGPSIVAAACAELVLAYLLFSMRGSGSASP